MTTTSTEAKSCTKDCGVWLLREILESITGSKLSYNQQVLRCYFYLHSYEK